MTSHGPAVVILARLLLVVAAALATFPPAAQADMMVVGNDQKVVWDAEGNRQFVEPGKDSISIVDISNREAPTIVASFPLMDSRQLHRQ